MNAMSVKSFAQKSHRIIPQRTHTGKKHYRCSECWKTFSHKFSLILHQKTHREVMKKVNIQKLSLKGNSSLHSRVYIGVKP